LPVASSSRASAVIALTWPVNVAYRSRAALICVVDAPGKFAATNIASAGSPVGIPNVIEGTTFCV
jgi:hypothetical protein